MKRTLVDMSRVSYDRLIAAETETERLRRENAYLQSRVDQLERRETMWISALAKLADRHYGEP